MPTDTSDYIMFVAKQSVCTIVKNVMCKLIFKIFRSKTTKRIAAKVLENKVVNEVLSFLYKITSDAKVL